MAFLRFGVGITIFALEVDFLCQFLCPETSTYTRAYFKYGAFLQRNKERKKQKDKEKEKDIQLKKDGKENRQVCIL